MVFVLDKSGSVGANNFNIAKKFVENVIEYFDIFPARTRVAIVSYSTFLKLEFNFNNHINKKCLRNAILKIRYDCHSVCFANVSCNRANFVFRLFAPHYYLVGVKCAWSMAWALGWGRSNTAKRIKSQKELCIGRG